MDYVIAIPSYKRAKTIRTLYTLFNHKIDKKKINLFIVEEEYDEYKNEPVSVLCNELIIGVKGLSQQREFITQYYPENTNIVCLDDDLEQISRETVDFCLDDFLQNAFKQCREQNAFIWGVYPVWNPFYRQTKEDTTCLNFICGAMYGIINRPQLQTIKHSLTSDSKEDIERSIKYFINDGIVLRFNKVGFKTKFYGKGGIGSFEDRLQPSLNDCEILLVNYPEFGKIKTRKNMMTEYVLNKIPSHKIHTPTYLDKLCENDVQELYEELEKINIPLMTTKMGRARQFGNHRSITLGYTKARVSRKIDISYYSKKFPKIYELLLQIGQKIGFRFTTIHLNHNVVCPPHKDKNNAGYSCIFSIGNYTGGKLIINGVEYDSYLQPLVFDGVNNTHYNTPIEGNKYSFIFFSI